MTDATPPLVTVGMPVRNGGAMFPRALESVLAQTHRNLEIIISDNGSTDGTAEIAQAAAAADPRVRYVRHDPPLTAFDNFMFVLGEARGAFFSWAAHDDLRSGDFIAGLLPAFEDPEVVLAFGDLWVTDTFGEPGRKIAYDFDNRGLSPLRRMRKQALMQCYHIYGLWRTAPLRAIRKVHCPWWPDLPIMMTMTQVGLFRHVDGVRFHYFEIKKTDAERTAGQDYRKDAGKVANILALMRATGVSVQHVGGSTVSAAGMVFVGEKVFAMAWDGAKRRLGRRRGRRTRD